MNRPLPILALATVLSAGRGWATPAPQDGQSQPDNTKVNQRDKNPGEATADNQKGNADDLALTAKIRKAVMADKSLSTYAHNIKIISQNGMVTLKGPVQSDNEVKSLMAKAADAAGGAAKVVNQLAVKQ
jgi:hyperosmotically inducible protein